MPRNGRSPSKRERSARYPGVALAECLALCTFIAEHGLDGLSAADIAAALGYRNLKTNTFSARLSAARQFGLLELSESGYALTDLVRKTLEAADETEASALHRQALFMPPLYAELAKRLAGKRVPDAPVLANVLENNFQITAAAKQSAAEAFLESARFAGALGDDLVLRPEGTARAEPRAESNSKKHREKPAKKPSASGVRLVLRLWGRDQGKVVRLRAPESMTRESFERLVQAIRLFVRIAEPGGADDRASD